MQVLTVTSPHFQENLSKYLYVGCPWTLPPPCPFFMTKIVPEAEKLLLIDYVPPNSKYTLKSNATVPQCQAASGCNREMIIL